MYVSLNEEKQYIEDKGTAEVSEDVVTEKSQVAETGTVTNEKSVDTTTPVCSNYYV